MMADQERCTSVFADLDDVLRLFNGVCDGLLEQDVLDTGGKSQLGGLNMERIGQRNSNCIQVFLLEKQRIVVIQRNAEFFRNLYIVIAKTSNSNQFDFRVCLCITSDFRALVQTENRKLNLIHQNPLP